MVHMKIFANDNEKWKIRLLIIALATLIAPLWIAVSSPISAFGFFMFMLLFVLRLDVGHYYDFRRLHSEYPVDSMSKNPFELAWKTQDILEIRWALLLDKQGKAKGEEYTQVSNEVKKFSKTRSKTFWKEYINSLIS